MTAPWGPPSETDVAAAPQHAGTPEQPSPADPERDELAVLDELEADLAAVEQAVASLERVTAEGLGGEAAAERIASAVSVERFGGAAAVDPAPAD